MLRDPHQVAEQRSTTVEEMVGRQIVDAYAAAALEAETEEVKEAEEVAEQVAEAAGEGEQPGDEAEAEPSQEPESPLESSAPEPEEASKLDLGEEE